MSTRPSPIVLKGAMVGGPDHRDNFADQRNDWKSSEVGGVGVGVGVGGVKGGLFLPLVRNS